VDNRPEATTLRLWAVVRYAARPDVLALRLAAAHTRAAGLAAAERHALTELEVKRASQQHAIGRLREWLAAAEELTMAE